MRRITSKRARVSVAGDSLRPKAELARNAVARASALAASQGLLTQRVFLGIEFNSSGFSLSHPALPLHPTLNLHRPDRAQLGFPRNLHRVQAAVDNGRTMQWRLHTPSSFPGMQSPAAQSRFFRRKCATSAPL